ncbi:TRSP domain-containing protein, partial [Acinetobacter baumannii]
AIQSALAFPDNYGLGIQNFVYNINPLEYDRVLITVETSADSVATSLLEAIPNAEVISAVEFPHQTVNLYGANE